MISGKTFGRLTKKKGYPCKRNRLREKLPELRMARRKCIGSGYLGKKSGRTLNVCWRLHRLIDLQPKVYCSLCTDMASSVLICPVMVPIRSVTVLIWSVMVHLTRRCFQHCLAYCLLPPMLVYFALMQPGLFSVYYLILCTTTKTSFSELPQALCWSAIIFSITRAVIILLPNIVWRHSLLALDILFPWAITMTRLAYSSGCCQ